MSLVGMISQVPGKFAIMVNSSQDVYVRAGLIGFSFNWPFSFQAFLHWGRRVVCHLP